MNKYTVPLDETLAREVMGDYPYEKLITLFDNVRVINVHAFKQIKGYEPDIASIFEVPIAGSVIMDYKGEEIVTHNSAIVRIGPIDYSYFNYEYEKLAFE